jgi:hypothetical protein
VRTNVRVWTSMGEDKAEVVTLRGGQNWNFFVNNARETHVGGIPSNLL